MSENHPDLHEDMSSPFSLRVWIMDGEGRGLETGGTGVWKSAEVEQGWTGRRSLRMLDRPHVIRGL